MNNSSKSDPRARLVAETFHENWADGPAAVFARRAAAHARTRRIVRRSFVTGSVVAAGAFAFFLSARRAPVAPLPAGAVAFALQPPAYEIISDTEFETLIRDRPLLILPQKNGEKKFVLLAR